MRTATILLMATAVVAVRIGLGRWCPPALFLQDVVVRGCADLLRNSVAAQIRFSESDAGIAAPTNEEREAIAAAYHRGAEYVVGLIERKMREDTDMPCPAPAELNLELLPWEPSG